MTTTQAARDLDVLRASVLEYTPVALNEIVAFFAPFVDDPGLVRGLGRKAIDFVLSVPLGQTPDVLPPALAADVAALAVRTASDAPADVAALVVHEGFRLGGEFGARRAGAAHLGPEVVEHFLAVMRAFEHLVLRVIGEAREREVARRGGTK